MKILNKNNLVGEQDIQSFENRLNTTLPMAYRQFIIQFNGGKPKHNLFTENEELGYLIVNSLYGIKPEKKYNDLNRSLEIYDGRISSNFIAIGSDPGGNQFCLGILGDFSGKVFFWDHEEEVDEDEFKDNILPENMYLLANDFNSFTEQLIEDK